MPLIEYVGFTPVVSVPTYQLSDVHAGVPIDVSEEIATDLTEGGTSSSWVVSV